jgi:hypothetical protein
MRSIRRTGLSVAASVMLTALPLLAITTAPSASAAPTWAPAATASIHPGVQVFTNGGQCTANFIFYDASNVYIGQAAHCSSTGNNTQTNGCTTQSLPIGTAVTITGASKPGTLVYNSWITMQQKGVTDANLCQFNDLALVRIDPSDVSSVNPSVPHWGGPTGINSSGLSLGQLVYSYGNSELRAGVTLLSPKTGISNGDDGAGWSHGTTMLLPGIPGDSGSPLLDSSGQATGVLSTLGVGIPSGATNNFGDVGRELSYANANGGVSVTLATGTVAFNANQLPLGL